MENQNNSIFFRIKYKKRSRSTGEPVILLEPLFSDKLDDYQYDIKLLDKDFPIHEISDDLHFVYESDIKDFFLENGDVKMAILPNRLRVLNHAAEEYELTQ